MPNLFDRSCFVKEGSVIRTIFEHLVVSTTARDDRRSGIIRRSDGSDDDNDAAHEKIVERVTVSTSFPQIATRFSHFVWPVIISESRALRRTIKEDNFTRLRIYRSRWSIRVLCAADNLWTKRDRDRFTVEYKFENFVHFFFLCSLFIILLNLPSKNFQSGPLDFKKYL